MTKIQMTQWGARRCTVNRTSAGYSRLGLTHACFPPCQLIMVSTSAFHLAPFKNLNLDPVVISSRVT